MTGGNQDGCRLCRESPSDAAVEARKTRVAEKKKQRARRRLIMSTSSPEQDQPFHAPDIEPATSAAAAPLPSPPGQHMPAQRPQKLLALLAHDSRVSRGIWRNHRILKFRKAWGERWKRLRALMIQLWLMNPRLGRQTILRQSRGSRRVTRPKALLLLTVIHLDPVLSLKVQWCSGFDPTLLLLGMTSFRGDPEILKFGLPLRDKLISLPDR